MSITDTTLNALLREEVLVHNCKEIRLQKSCLSSYIFLYKLCFWLLFFGFCPFCCYYMDVLRVVTPFMFFIFFSQKKKKGKKPDLSFVTSTSYPAKQEILDFLWILTYFSQLYFQSEKNFFIVPCLTLLFSNSRWIIVLHYL